ncbi:hypothetical protein GCM10010472_30230 [Pseudonocardia halophobica]|uniref:Uncharacterized protein n=1 Tax=Pseudonocardia halophobica TaxID=29401 RepID=A0A9W6NUG0_9PSEU|nr:hypothetical protein GCM10017577_04220 [Pseudonocardia halophobica]
MAILVCAVTERGIDKLNSKHGGRKKRMSASQPRINYSDNRGIPCWRRHHGQVLRSSTKKLRKRQHWLRESIDPPDTISLCEGDYGPGLDVSTQN